MGGKEGNGKYPTLYLLHGMSDDHTIWQRRTSIERYVSDLGLAVVMPSTHLGWYTDMYRGHKWWTYISQELPQICHNSRKSKNLDAFAAGAGYLAGEKVVMNRPIENNNNTKLEA